MSKKVTYDEFMRILQSKGTLSFIWPDDKEFKFYILPENCNGKKVVILGSIDVNQQGEYICYVYEKDYQFFYDYCIEHNYFDIDDTFTYEGYKNIINTFKDKLPKGDSKNILPIVYWEDDLLIYTQSSGKIDTFKIIDNSINDYTIKSTILGDEYIIYSDISTYIFDTSNKYVEILDYTEDEDIDKISKDIIYNNIEESDKLKIKESTNFNSFTIVTIDTNFPIITFEKEDNSNSYIFLVDIQDNDEFKYKTKIKTKNDLNKAIDFVMSSLENHPILNKYVDDIENLKM